MYLNKTHTKRLQIKALTKEDSEVWKEFFIDNPSLPYLGIDLSPTAEEQAQRWIQYQLDRYESGRYGHHALLDKETGEFIGQCGLLTQEINGEEVLEVGYHILPKYWGKGYATEAAKYFKDYAFENNLCERLVSIIDVRNIASQKVACKNGMNRGTQIKYYDLDVFVYEISKEDWIQQAKLEQKSEQNS